MDGEKEWVRYMGPNETEIYIEVTGPDEKGRKDAIRKLNRLVLGDKSDQLTVETIFVDSSD